jgi:ketosteroid isomerase-like protein
MSLLSEDATYLAGGLAILAVIFLIVMKTTQQGKFLLWAGVALGLAVVALLIEQLWVTDNERIESVVHALRRAVASSDAPGVLAHLTPDVVYVMGGGPSIAGETTRGFIESELAKVKFDFVRITRLQAHAGGQSGRGSAEFRVLAGGSYQTVLAAYNFGATNLDFSLGFRKTEPNVWKVERITLTHAPRDMPLPGGIRPRRRFRRPPGAVQGSP